MMQFNNISAIPTNYPFRYTIDFHVRMMAAKNNMGIEDVVKEILSLLDAAKVGLSERHFRRYRTEAKDSTKAEMSYERREIIGEYCGLSDPDALITNNIIQQTINEL